MKFCNHQFYMKYPFRSKESATNPLKDWGNDDLLINKEAREVFAKAAPGAFRVFDWPDLREAFDKHNLEANQAKQNLNRHGLTGALLSAAGASVLSLSQLLSSSTFQNGVIILGCSFVLSGAIMGIWHIRGHTGRSKWLLERLWTERLRQFNFQYVINNIDAAVRAISDDAHLEEYRSKRDGALQVFINQTEQNLSARGFADAIRWLADDHEDAHVWGQSIWQTNQVIPGSVMTTEHRELFECLSQRRIGIQEIYAQSNLNKDYSSQASMARRNFIRGNIATFVFVAALTLAGLWLLVDGNRARMTSETLIAVSGFAAAWGLYFRMVDQGMGYSLDSERYQLYAEQVGLVRQRFNAAADNISDKIAALRQLELYAYSEMRQFLRTHLRSQFLV